MFAVARMKSNSPVSKAPPPPAKQSSSAPPRWNIGNLAMLRPSKNSNEGNDRVSSAALSVDSMVREAVQQPGRPLDAASRAYFEPRFGADFSQVRIHTDEHAAESARSIDALAYTIGTDIVLGAGARQASSGARSRLMAHELAHVVQQGGSKASRPQRMAMTSPGDATEREAEAAATAVSRGASYHLARGNAGAIARQTSEAETMPGAEAPSPAVPMGGQGAATRPARPSSSSFLTAYSKIGYNVWKGEEQRHNVWAFVGGSVGKTFDGENTCATRVSYGLDYGGSPIKGFDNTFSYHNYSTVSFEGKAGDDQNYIVGAPAMATYFLKHYGAPDAHLSKGQDGLDFESRLPKDKCAVFAGTHHSGVIKDSSFRDPYVMSDPDVLPVDAWILD